MEPWIGVLGTLLGTAGGASITYFIQSAAFRRDLLQRQLQENREAALSFLQAVQMMYESILQRATSEQSEGERPERPSPANGQQALESLRLTNSDAVVRVAEDLWAHLRSHPIAQGKPSSKFSLAGWKQQYWALRKRLVNQVRSDFGLPKLGTTSLETT